MALKPSTIRQYHALRRLARDQAGQPEGQTAKRVADKMLAKHPELAQTRDPDAQSPRPGGSTGQRRPYTGSRPSGGPSFRELIRDIAAQNGAEEAAEFLDGVEQAFPGLLDQAVMDFARRIFGGQGGSQR